MGTDAGKVGLMKKSMYGTRDAASNWECDWQKNVKKWGFQLGVSSKNLQKMRDRDFEARHETIVTGTRAKSRSKGRSVSVERKQGDCYHWRAEGKGAKGDACSFRHDESRRGHFTRSSSPTPKSQTNNDAKKIFERKVAHRHQSIWKNASKTVQGIPQWKLYQPLV